MAIEVKRSSNASTTRWLIGDWKMNQWVASEIEYIEASGDELEKILREIDGIPKCKSSSVRWFGDDAKFIMSNLL